MHMMLQHARLFLANRSVTIETLLRLNSPQIAFVDSWAMARSTFCVQDWDLTALMSGPPTHKKKYIKIKKKNEKMWKWKKKCGTEVETWAQPQDCAEKPLQDTPDQSGRQLRKMKAGMSAWAQKNIARNDGLQWQSRSYHAIMHQVHTTWGKLH